MSKWSEGLDIGLKIALLGLVFTLMFAVVFKFTAPVTLNLNGKSISYDKSIEGDVKDWIILAERFAETHEYNKTDYNCKNYSDDLKFIADELGFKVEIVDGWYSSTTNETGHSWLRLKIDYEPQSGEFTDYTKEYPYQKVRR